MVKALNLSPMYCGREHPTVRVPIRQQTDWILMDLDSSTTPSCLFKTPLSLMYTVQNGMKRAEPVHQSYHVLPEITARRSFPSSMACGCRDPFAH